MWGRIMYVRTVSFVVKPFQVKRFCDCVDGLARNVASKQPGFLEHVVLVSEQEKRLITSDFFLENQGRSRPLSGGSFP